MREIVKKEIDGYQYEIQQFNTTTACKVLARLVKVIGEPVTLAMKAFGIKPPKKIELVDGVPPPVAESFPKDILSKEFNGDLMAKAISSLVEKLDDNDVLYIVQNLTENGVVVNGAKVVFDDHYAGKLGHLTKVVQAAFEVQFGNFFGAVAGKAAAAGSPPA